MSIYDIVHKDIRLRKESPTHRALVMEVGCLADVLIDKMKTDEEMRISDFDSFYDDYVLIYGH